MGRIQVLCVGRLRERYWQEACAEYAKRLRPYCSLEITEVKERGRLLPQTAERAYVIALSPAGRQLDSEAFAAHMEALQLTAAAGIVFVIGDADGIGEEMMERADESLSFSGMTFPHQMARVILLEQLYRSFRIRNGEPYHK